MARPLSIGHRHHITAPRTPLIGREDAVRDVLALLTRPDTAIVTIIGPGGVGKTRLALQIATEAREHVVDGAVFVGLGAVHHAARLLDAIAAELGVRETADEPLVDTIVDALHDLDLLLVLDNVEQITASGPLLASLIDRLPAITLLVASRVRLHLTGERVYPLAPLPTPARDGTATLDRLAAIPSVRLFVDRAGATLPGFALSDTNADAVASVCRQLDGLPLAIELAAARTSTLTPQMLRDRMGRSSLDLLATDAADRPARHRTMTAAIAWSYDLLEPGEQHLLRTLAVFAGGFTLEAAERVWAASGSVDLDATIGTMALVDRSMVRPLEQVGEETRFTLLETIREFAIERLAETPDAEVTWRHHAAWALDVAEASEPQLRGPDQTVWLARLIAEHDNLRAALTWATGHDTATAMRLANAMWLFWYMQGHLAEGQRWLERALQGPGDVLAGTRGEAMNNLGNLVYELGDLDRANELYQHSLTLRREAADRSGEARTLNNLGMLATARGQPDLARPLLEASLALHREIGNTTLLPPTMNNLGDAAIVQGDGASARSWNQRALEMSREQGNTRRVAHSLHNLGLAHRCDGDDIAASVLFTESLALFERVGDRPGVATVRHSLGRVAARARAATDAVRHETVALELHRQVLDRRGLVRCLQGAALLADAAGDAGTCARLLGAAEGIRGQMVPLQPPVDAEDVSRASERTRRRLGAAAYSAALTTGSVLSRDRAIDLALSTLGAPAEGHAALSRREREVLRLMAQGMSNQQIADALFISLRTVKAHATAIFTKLGLSSRSAAVAHAHRHGLT